jgi:ABC-type Fe3+ transport system permease subunit
VTALALAVGSPLGVLLGRSDVPGRRALLVVHGFCALVPPLVVALALVQVAMAAGILVLGSRTLAAGAREARP